MQFSLTEMAQTGKNRVLIPKKDWTPINNEVFEELRNLKQKRGAALYLFLYDRAYHRPSQVVAATLAQLNRATGMDERVIQKCLRELSKKQLIVQVRRGVLHSRTRRDCWEVPLANFKLTDGGWTPIPRILIREYQRAYPNAVLPPLLLFYQHLSRMNFCYPGAGTLSKRLNWPRNRINGVLRTMFDDQSWDSLDTGLVRPLICKVYTNKNGQKRRSFTVRAVRYTEEKKPSDRSVRMSRLFQDRYGIGVE